VHQSTSLSTVTSGPVNTITTTCSSTATGSIACSKKLQGKSASPQADTETIGGQKLTAVCCTAATTRASNVQHRPKAPLKQSSECHSQNKPSADRTKSIQQPSDLASPLAADTSPQILAKLAKGKHGHKIGQPAAEVVNSSAGQKHNQQPVATALSSSSSAARNSPVKHRYSVCSHTSSSKPLFTSSKLATDLPNGLVTHNSKPCSKTDPHGHTAVSSHHGTPAKPLAHLPNGLQAHADKICAKTTKHPSQSGSTVQHGSEHPGTTAEVANGPSGKTPIKNDSKADKQNGHVRVSKSSEACSRLLMDISREGHPVNGHNEHVNAAAATAKSKKARRKGRGKEAFASVG